MSRNLILIKNRHTTVMVHSSTIPVLILFVWILSANIFPFYYRRLSEITYWWMGIAGTVALCFSICFHEALHVVVSNKYGGGFNRTILFYFGGVSFSDHLTTVTETMLVFVSGPLGSAFIALIFHILFIVGGQNNFSIEILGLIDFVRMINVAISLVNLLPIFPFDCGRMLNEILTVFTDNNEWVMGVQKTVSDVFASLLIIFGILSGFRGRIAGGGLWVMAGYFVLLGTRYLYHRHSFGIFFKTVKVATVMSRDLVWVDENMSVKDFIEQYYFKYQYKIFPVIGRRLYLLQSQRALSIPPGEWKTCIVRDIANGCQADDVVYEEDGILPVFVRMKSSGVSNCLVISRDKEIKGIVTSSDIVKCFSNQLLQLQQLSQQ